MTDPSNRSDDPAAETPPANRPRKGRRQIGLRTVFLLICAVAAWLGVYKNRETTRSMRSRLDDLRSLARELEVDDPGRIAVVQKQAEWMDENRWDLYLPAGSYRLCMATRGVGSQGFPSVMRSMPIRSGRHRLALDQRTRDTVWRAILTCDGSEQLAIEEPESFTGDSASTSEQVSISEQFPAPRPVVLIRCQFSSSNAGGGPFAANGKSNGLMVWIEPDPGVKPAR